MRVEDFKIAIIATPKKKQMKFDPKNIEKVYLLRTN